MNVKPLLIMDFDGVWNALNRERVWIGEHSPTDLDYALPDPKMWKMESYPVSNETYFSPDRNELVDFEGREIRIQWSTELVGEVNQLIKDNKVDFLWLTTWKGYTDTTLNPVMGLNVPTNSWVKSSSRSGSKFFITSYDYYQAGKWLALQDYFATIPLDRRPPVIWFEDVTTIGMSNFKNDNVKVVTEELKVPSLVFQTDPKNGVAREEWEYAKKWISSL